MERGYTVIPDWMLGIEGIDIYELLILAVIYGHSQDDGSAFRGSQAHLARKCKCSRRKVVLALEHLVELGLIAKADTEVKGVHRCEYSYTGGLCMTCTGAPHAQGGCAPHAQGGCAPHAQGGCAPHAQGRARVPLSGRNININNNISDISHDIDIKEDKEKPRQKEKEEKKDAKFDFRRALLDAGVSAPHVAEWMEIRKLKKAVNSRTAFNLLLGEAKRAGLTVEQAVVLCIEESWKGFRACYLRGRFPAYVGGGRDQGGLLERNRAEMAKALEMIMQDK